MVGGAKQTGGHNVNKGEAQDQQMAFWVLGGGFALRSQPGELLRAGGITVTFDLPGTFRI